MKNPLLLATALLALGAAPAAADTYVTPNGYDEEACNQAHPCASIARGVQQAQPGDTVHIAPGLYAESVILNKRVRLLGSGAGGLGPADPSTETIIHPPGAGPAIATTAGGEFRHLKAIGGHGSNGANGGTALDLRGGGAEVRTYVVEDVTAIGGQGNGVGAEGGSALTLFSIDGGRSEILVRSSRLGQADDGFSQQAIDLDSTSVRFEDVVVRPGWSTALEMNGDTDVEAVGLDVRGAAALNGLAVSAGGRLDLRRSTVIVPSRALALSGYDAAPRNTRAEVRDSLLVATGTSEDSTAIGSRFGGNPGLYADGNELLLRGSTVVARGADPDAALLLEAPFAGTGVSADVANTILRTVDTAGAVSGADIRISPGAGYEAVVATNSSFTDVVNLGGGSVPAPGDGTNIAGAPGFADAAAGDFTLVAGSPLVDAGAATWATQPFDAAGAARVTDGDGDCTARPDVGALERPAQGCAGGGSGATTTDSPGDATTAAGSATPAGDAPGGGTGTSPTGSAGPDRTAPRLTGLRLAKKRVRLSKRGAIALPAARFTLSEPATVKLVVERRKGGAWKRVRTVGKSAPAGAASIALPRLKRAAAGRHRYRLVATDAAGNRSAAGIVALRVLSSP